VLIVNIIAVITDIDWIVANMIVGKVQFCFIELLKVKFGYFRLKQINSHEVMLYYAKLSWALLH
jgi:hypothetical protein